MEWTTIFYWLTVVSEVKFILFVIGAISVCFCAGSLVWAMGTSYPDDEFKRAMKYTRIWFIPVCIIWLLYVLLPTKKETLLIIAGSGVAQYIVSDNSQLPEEVNNYLMLRLYSLSESQNLEIKNFNDVIKQKMIKKSLEMDNEKLIERMKSDSVFRKTILEDNE